MWRQNAEQARPVALEQELEGALVAASDEGDQPLVRLEPEQRRAAGEQADCVYSELAGLSIVAVPRVLKHRSKGQVA